VSTYPFVPFADLLPQARLLGHPTSEIRGPTFLVSQEGPRGELPALSGPLPESLPESYSGGRRARVLIIEDNRDAADSLQILLEVLGHEVRVAYTGPDGLAQAGAWLPEVVLSDIGLPGMDGYAIARALRAEPATARLRLIAITGYGTEADRRLAAEAGFDHHLTKPVEAAVLLALIQEPAPGA
jgi:CheY-like chemotaxis protein